MIEQLLIDLAKAQEPNFLFAVIFVIGLAIVISGIFIGCINWKPNQVNHGNHLIALGVVMIVISFGLLFHTGMTTGEIKDQIKDIHIENIKNMECNDIRLLNLSIIERQHEPYKQPYDYERQLHDWQENYYHTKCEIPLREEVMKLQ